MPEFKHSNYMTHRIKPLRAYIDRMRDYLQLYYPEVSAAQIQQFVEQQVNQNLQSATADVLYHPVPGTTKRQSVSLLQHLQTGIAQNIIVPSGSCYMLPTVKESFLKVTLADKKKQRSVYKKAMLQALTTGDIALAENNNFLQSTTKIFLNSAPGAMGSPHNPLYDLPGYNAITSSARHSVKHGYAHVERLVEGNLYLRDYNDAVNYCLGLTGVIPQDWNNILRNYQLYLPSTEETIAYLESSIKYYTLYPPSQQLKDFISRLTPEKRAFIFYAGNLRNLFRFNNELFREFFKTFFHIPSDFDITVDPATVFKIEHDLLAMVTSLNYELLGKDPETDNYFEVEKAVLQNPDGVRKIISIARHMEQQLQTIESLFVAVLRIDTDISNVQNHNNMIRRCVIVSDTDSVIFSMQSMIEWYSGEIIFKRSSYEINAFVVYLISRSLEHVFARQSCGFGMIGSDTQMITMKNEFLYPIFMRAPIKKTYAGISTIQEGKILATPKKDIKGLQFRSSVLSRETNTVAEEFVTWVLTTAMKDVKISIEDLYKKISAFELRVYNSIIAGEKTFLPTVSVKDKSDYVNSDITGYFYYELWQSVFIPEFDSIQLPNKCFKLPLKDDGRILSDPNFIKTWVETYPEIYDRYQKFRMLWPKKQISYLLLPPTLVRVPELLRSVIDIRTVISNNCQPLYLVLETLGIGLAYAKQDYLVTDFYNPTNIEVALT